MIDQQLHSYSFIYYWELKNKLYRLDYEIDNLGKEELIPQYNALVKEINELLDRHREWAILDRREAES